MLEKDAVQAHRHLELTPIHAARREKYGELNSQVTEEDDGKELLTHMQQTP